jgi:hypothetical protein
MFAPSQYSLHNDNTNKAISKRIRVCVSEGKVAVRTDNS